MPVTAAVVAAVCAVLALAGASPLSIFALLLIAFALTVVAGVVAWKRRRTTHARATMILAVIAGLACAAIAAYPISDALAPTKVSGQYITGGAATLGSLPSLKSAGSVLLPDVSECARSPLY